MSKKWAEAEVAKQKIMLVVGEPMATLIDLCWDKEDEYPPTVEELYVVARGFEIHYPGLLEIIVKRRHGVDDDGEDYFDRSGIPRARKKEVPQVATGSESKEV